jgi:hypothetical protein
MLRAALGRVSGSRLCCRSGFSRSRWMSSSAEPSDMGLAEVTPAAQRVVFGHSALELGSYKPFSADSETFFGLGGRQFEYSPENEAGLSECLVTKLAARELTRKEIYMSTTLHGVNMDDIPGNMERLKTWRDAQGRPSMLFGGLGEAEADESLLGTQLGEMVDHVLDNMQLNKMDQLFVDLDSVIVEAPAAFTERDLLLGRVLASIAVLVEAGKLETFGWTSSFFAVGREDPNFMDIARLLDLADKQGLKDRFTSIRMPVNLMHAGIFGSPNAQVAREHGISLEGIMASEAHLSGDGDHVVFGSFSDSIDRHQLTSQLQLMAENAAHTETDFPAVAGKSKTPGLPTPDPWAQVLVANPEVLTTYETWESVKHTTVRPSLKQFLGTVMTLHDESELTEWAGKYHLSMEALIEVIEASLEYTAHARTVALDEYLVAKFPSELGHIETLQQKALAVLSSLPVDRIVTADPMVMSAAMQGQALPHQVAVDIALSTADRFPDGSSFNTEQLTP